MTSYKAHIELMRSIGMLPEQAHRGLRMISGASTGTWPQSLRRRPGLTMGDLPESEPVHPKRFLDELAAEFDQARPPLSLLLAAQPQVFKMTTIITD